MKILLTGAAGFVGRAAVDILSQDHEVTAFDIRPVEGYDNAVQGDVLDYPTLETVMADHNGVVNTIMAPNGSYGMDGPGFDINVRGMFNLLEAARKCEIQRFVHTSSGAVHGGYPEDTFLTYDLYPLKAASSYDLSKLVQEELARNYHEQHGLAIACIRPWGIIDSDKMVTTDGHPVNDFYYGTIDRRDVASALKCALETPDIGYDCFYIFATPGGYKKGDVARTEKLLGWEPVYRFDVDL